jgi:probable phosphoglycerate mutase
VLKAGLGAGAPVVAYSYRGLGRATNNVAEYEGLILGLLLVQDLALAPGRLVAVRGDSMLVVNQLTGAWAVKDANMEKLHAEACRLLLATGVSSRAIEHVYREANAEADHYANIAMDTQGGQSYREAAFFPGHRAKEADTPAAAAVAAASSSSSSAAAAAAAAPTPPTSVAAAAAAAVAATVAGMADAAPAVGRKRERASGDRGDDAAGPAAQRRRS